MSKLLVPSKVDRRLLRLQRRDVLIESHGKVQVEPTDSIGLNLQADLHFLLNLQKGGMRRSSNYYNQLREGAILSHEVGTKLKETDISNESLVSVKTKT